MPFSRANHQRGHDRPDPDIAPADDCVRKKLEDHGEKQDDDREIEKEIDSDGDRQTSRQSRLDIMTETLEQGFNDERNEEEETNSAHHCKRNETGAQKPRDPLPRFRFDSPDRVQRILQLAKNPARAE